MKFFNCLLFLNLCLISFGCLPGRYIDDDECKPCPKGYFSVEENSNHCTPCPINTYSDNEGSSVCSFCIEGYFTKVEGSTKCISNMNGGATEMIVIYIGMALIFLMIISFLVASHI